MGASIRPRLGSAVGRWVLALAILTGAPLLGAWAAMRIESGRLVEDAPDADSDDHGGHLAAELAGFCAGIAVDIAAMAYLMSRRR
jgi:hypothetical protein